jgi:nitrate reductase delta subunit
MSSPEETDVLRASYAVLGDLWCSGSDVDVERTRDSARALRGRLETVDGPSARSLGLFLEQGALADEDSIELFELAPKCSLYLGSHVYEEPTTCAGAGVSDRNDYMIDLLGVYRHFGRVPTGRELPDYLPLMLDFLSGTAGLRDDAVRRRFLEKYFLPFVPPMRKRLEALDTPYVHLLDAAERLVQLDLGPNREAVAHG